LIFYIEQIRLIKQLFPSYEILAVHWIELQFYLFFPFFSFGDVRNAALLLPRTSAATAEAAEPPPGGGPRLAATAARTRHQQQRRHPLASSYGESGRAS
jgi:hypothetical protein